MNEYIDDIKKYTSSVNEAIVKTIVNYCGIALRNRDSSLVSASDKSELNTVRDGLPRKNLNWIPILLKKALMRYANVCKKRNTNTG